MVKVTRLGITLGDPSGIGPEIVASALATMPSEWLDRVIVYGDRAPLERGASAMSVTLPAITIIGDGLGDAATPGKPDEQAGAAQVGYLEAACAAAVRGELAAIVTAPISKTWARRGGFPFMGHTEFLAARLGAKKVAMLFAGPRLKVALTTVHRPLAEVVEDLSTERVREVIELVVDSMVRDFGMAAPRIGVVGLNPHAGEDGLLGDEDHEIIEPAIEVPLPPAQLFGPLVPDAAFRDALDGKYDAMIAMYHDQGLIPVKLIDFDEAVNCTLGLPIPRTSPDHGTAYDIAGTGKARPISMQRALSLAIDMIARRGNA
ncbi:MAG: 4-hydroxythreonine-4-phosphate dehydrogenase PdxA [Myxococcota bacterium]|nr:4-hydroxythreonine-4-phosphate dehydrogenase PdxA [Myxococcota bacterium]